LSRAAGTIDAASWRGLWCSGGVLVLLGDSRPLFSKMLLAYMQRRWPHIADVRAVYLGAANGDETAYFELFAGAMDAHGIRYVTHVRCDDVSTHALVDAAELVFLAGGDPLRGLRSLIAHGLLERVVARHRAGAMLIGSSAGSMLLGARVWDGENVASIVDGARLVPFAMDAHAEPDWKSLRALCAHEPDLRGIGLCSGGGVCVEGEALTAIGNGWVEAGR
jgi:peptidase E